MARLLPATWPGDPSLGSPRRHTRPCHYEAYLPDPLVGRVVLLPPDVAEALHDAEQAIQGLNLEGSSIAGFEGIARIILRAESVASSRIEGLEVGARRLLRAEASRAMGEPGSDVTAQAVLGNIEAMEFAVGALAERPRVSRQDILETHALIMRRTERPDWAGAVRTTQNWIGGYDSNPCTAGFVPPPPEEVGALLEDLVAYMNDDEHQPLLQAAMVHHQFEVIHPFGDGNGRVGRALIHAVLRRRGLAPRYLPPVSLVLSTRSKQYVAGLRAASYLGEPTGPAAVEGVAHWLRVFASAASRAAMDAAEFGKQIEGIVAGWRESLGRVRANSAAELILGVLPSAPVITVATVARLIGRSVPQTNAAVNRMVQEGVLAPVREVRWNRAFEAVGLIDAITVFERSLGESNTPEESS